MMGAVAGQKTSRRLALSGAVIGFALGGFFDGILLHQILQWHHLFSLVPGDTWRDIRMQIMMDGWFHVFHYGIAAIGLWLLWTARAEITASRRDRMVIGAALLGFSLWQFIDVVLFHWVLVIHRIRVDVPNPLTYDLGWLAIFGVTTLVLGMALWRAGPSSGGRTGRAASTLAGLVALAGPVAGVPMQSDATLVLFRADVDPARSMSAVAEVGDAVLWSSPGGELVAFKAKSAIGSVRRTWHLYANGAAVVSSSPLLGGCLGWAETPFFPKTQAGT